MTTPPQRRGGAGDVLVHVVRLRPVERRDEADAQSHFAGESSRARFGYMCGMTVEIRVREDGPYIVRGPVRVVDANGDDYELPTNKPNVALCRCGGSRTKPFCDGTHRTRGFVLADTAAAAPPHGSS
jgi:CDGSH-type Zn-finger protein